MPTKNINYKFTRNSKRVLFFSIITIRRSYRRQIARYNVWVTYKTTDTRKWYLRWYVESIKLIRWVDRNDYKNCRSLARFDSTVVAIIVPLAATRFRHRRLRSLFPRFYWPTRVAIWPIAFNLSRSIDHGWPTRKSKLRFYDFLITPCEVPTRCF